MALRIELWVAGRLTGGVEEWWDGVEAALAGTTDDYPLLASVSPYGEWIVPLDRVSDLGAEARRLANATTSGRTAELLSRLADLCTQVEGQTDAELRFSGD